MAGGGKLHVPKEAWVDCTVPLILICLLYSMRSIFFGDDGASFGGVQTFGPFLRKIGRWDPENDDYAIPTYIVSLMNSLPLVGKSLGAVIVGSMIERRGHRLSMAITCVVQVVGTVIQVTSHTPPQFIVGRMLIYGAVGLVENVVPTYESEICPAPLRGFCVGSIQLFLTFGSLIAGVVNEGLSKLTTDAGWMVATGIQMVPAIIILSGLYFSHQNRRSDALKALKVFRPKKAVDDGLCELEILTGVTFSSSYGPTFYKQVGLGDKAFAYAAINNSVSVATAVIGMYLFDVFGRRDLTFHGCWGQALFLCLIGGLGSEVNRTTSDTNGMVASFILYAAILHATLGPAAYITAAKVGTATLREKTMALSTAWNVVVGSGVVYSTPYLLSTPGAKLGARLGYVWGACAGIGAIWVWFFMPEFKQYECNGLDRDALARYQAKMEDSKGEERGEGVELESV
ncbi:major facilitator superfamily domain-containing protein [Aspergillus aurantiobrunneus]